MLDELPRARTPDLERVFKALSTEEQQRVQDDRRAVGRMPFVRPTVIKSHSTNSRPVESFSRNLSPAGIGIVSKEPFKLGDVGTIEIHRFRQSPVIVLAECRWCDSFGSTWYFSGWVFLSTVRD